MDMNFGGHCSTCCKALWDWLCPLIKGHCPLQGVLIWLTLLFWTWIFWCL